MDNKIIPLILSEWEGEWMGAAANTPTTLQVPRV